MWLWDTQGQHSEFLGTWEIWDSNQITRQRGRVYPPMFQYDLKPCRSLYYPPGQDNNRQPGSEDCASCCRIHLERRRLDLCRESQEINRTRVLVALLWDQVHLGLDQPGRAGLDYIRDSLTSLPDEGITLSHTYMYSKVRDGWRCWKPLNMWTHGFLNIVENSATVIWVL